MSGAKSPLESDREKWSQLAQRAATDQELKQRLLSDPARVLEAEGVTIPEGSRINVTEENGQWQFVIEGPIKASAAAAGELSGDAMSHVVGGGGKQTPTETISFSFGKVQWIYS
jgi:hypothetical protein